MLKKFFEKMIDSKLTSLTKTIDDLQNKINDLEINIDYYELSKKISMTDLAKEFEIDYSELSDNVNFEDVADNIDYKKLAFALIEIAKAKV